jgi:Tol biopolymer transport system component/DNA-binding winged helix-turn-helix (wHTH) protein
MASTPQRPGIPGSPPSTAGGSAPLRIAGRLVEPALHRVTGPQGPATLEPKVLQVLLCLAGRPGQVVAKEEILARVWNGTFVTDDVLTRAIAELRRTFGDEAAAPHVIETIRKGGYRLIAPVQVEAPAVPEESGQGSIAPAADGARSRRRLAVFVALGVVEIAVIAGVYLLRSRDTRLAAPMRIVPLTAAAGSERDPAVSPDGTRVAYVWNGGSGEDYSLYVKLTDGGAPLRLTREAPAQDRAPAWSPDGRSIAFTRATSSACDILIAPALGGTARRLGPCGDRDYRRLAWSPDGRSIAISRREGNSPLAIEIVSVESGARRVLTHPPPNILGDTSPSFSPDGALVAFDRNVSDGAGDIYTVSASGGESRRLTFDARDLMGIDWAAGGRSLIFSSSRAGIYSLWRVASSGGEPVWFAGAGTKMKHPSTARAPGKNVLAFENWTYEVNLWRVPSGPKGAGEARRVTETTDQWNFQPDMSPDGRRLAFVSTRTGEQQLWSQGTDGSIPVRLTSFEGARIETPRWASDAKRLVFSARLRGRADLYMVDGAGGAAQKLTNESTDAVLPSWAADGRSILFSSRRSGAWDIWRLALADRRIIRVTNAGGYASRESSDGRFLYFTRTDAAGIWRQPADGSADPVRVVDTLLPEDWANWEVGREGLYLRETPAGERQPLLVLYPFEQGARRVVTSLADQGWPGFAVTPDGGSIIYPRIDRQSCEIRLIENYR